MGFLSEQIKKETTKIEISEQTLEENKEKLSKDTLDIKYKTEEDTAIEKCEQNFYSLIQDMLKRFQEIDFEHIKKAFNKAIKKLEDDYTSIMEKKID